MNLGQIRTQLQGLGYSTDTATQQNAMINGVYRQIAGEQRWRWMQTLSTALTTTLGSPTVSLAPITDLMWIDTVRIEQGTEYDDLEYLPPQELRALEHTDRSNGVPENWTEHDQKLHFYPRPDGVYTITLDYITTPPELAADGDQPLFDTTFHDILVWGAAMHMAHRERDWFAHGRAKEEYMERLRAMRGAYGIAQQQTSRTIQRWAGWDALDGWC